MSTRSSTYRTNQEESGPRSRPNGATDQLVRSFKQLISDRVFIPGSKLPPEREMAKQFGISRPTLRHVLKILEAMGVVTQRVGDGTYLNEASDNILSEPLEFLVLLQQISHDELFEARLVVEPELAAKAAQTATSADLKTMKDAIDAMAKSSTIAERFSADARFHEAIFQAAGNRFFRLVFSIVHKQLLDLLAITSHRSTLQEPLNFHRRIYQAIFDRDPETAFKEMAEHLRVARKLLVEPAAERARSTAGAIAPLRGRRK